MKTGRVYLKIKDGSVIVAQDAHYWPGIVSTAHKALLWVARAEKPDVMVLNGDAIDASTISRHPPIGWEKHPKLRDELDAAKERTGEIVDATPNSRHIWTLGNHDERFETMVATKLPEYKGVHGVHLKDHFPLWEPAWGVVINNDVLIKHRWHGGLNAAYTNALKSGLTMVTGHYHRLVIRALSDEKGTRYGIEAGMLADPHGPQFEGYTESATLDWTEGFVILRFHSGKLLFPEVIRVTKPGEYEWNGEIFKV